MTTRHPKITTALTAAAAIVLTLTSCSGSHTTSFHSVAVKNYVTTALNFMSSYGLNAGSHAWSLTRSKVLEATSKDTQVSQTYPALREAVGVAGDPRHSAFQTPGTTAGAASRTLSNQLPTAVQLGSGITMVTVPTHTANNAADSSAYVASGAAAILAAAPTTTCGWVVDLRGNQGGDVYPMLASLSPLLGQGHLISYVDRDHRSTWVSLDGSDITYKGSGDNGDATVSAPPGASSAAGKAIAILQGPETASSAEATVLALMGQKNSHTFGQTTAGLASANVSKKLPDDAVITLTSAWTSNASGATYPSGIPAATRTSTDQSTVKAATTWIQSQCGR